MSDTELVKFLAQHGVETSVAEMDEVLEDFLAHYDVKGMKWGVRKDRFAAGGIDLNTGSLTLNPVSRAGDGMTRKEIREINKMSKAAKKIFDSPDSKAAYGSLMRAGAAEMAREGRDLRDKNVYRELASKTFSSILKTGLDRGNYKGISVKVAPAGEDLFTVVLGSPETVKSAIADLGLEKLAHDNSIPVELVLLKVDPDNHSYTVGYTSLTHSDDLDNFLAHYGVKGMKWGVRRSQAELDRVAGRDGGSEGTKKRAKGLKGVAQARRERKEAKARETLENEARRVASTTPEISADAERFVKTSMKAGASMSDQEIKKYLGRARLVKEYEQLTSKPTKSQVDLLKEQYEVLNYTKKISDLKREMTPKKVSKVDKFVKRAGQAYAAYAAVDKATGGELSKKLGGDLMNMINDTGKIHVQETRSTPNTSKPKSKKRKRSKSDDQVYNITTLGR